VVWLISPGGDQFDGVARFVFAVRVHDQNGSESLMLLGVVEAGGNRHLVSDVHAQIHDGDFRNRAAQSLKIGITRQIADLSARTSIA